MDDEDGEAVGFDVEDVIFASGRERGTPGRRTDAVYLKRLGTRGLTADQRPAGQIDGLSRRLPDKCLMTLR